ncbi:Sua5/YciO/YrdC/YwlC family protein [Aeromonas hydrophila]|uniref:Sua5/YciO/YrdC/YwlC family protein n=1 Tax=Aeromonas hydrophila TaxID=644 RepID=UPI003BF49121
MYRAACTTSESIKKGASLYRPGPTTPALSAAATTHVAMTNRRAGVRLPTEGLTLRIIIKFRKPYEVANTSSRYSRQPAATRHVRDRHHQPDRRHGDCPDGTGDHPPADQ